MKIVLLIILLIYFGNSFSQNSEIDSLKNELKKAHLPDTQKIKIVEYLSFCLTRVNMEEAEKYSAANKMPVGHGERKENFIQHNVEANKGDMLYLYTDGYADQFGGPKGKKFKYKQLDELLLEISSKELNLQSEILNQKFAEWKGDLEQVDDVCVVGIKI